MTSQGAAGVQPVGRVLREVVVPRCEGRAVEVRAGQVLRIVALDGPQVADSTFLALDNPPRGLSRRPDGGPQHAGRNGDHAADHHVVVAPAL